MIRRKVLLALAALALVGLFAGAALAQTTTAQNNAPPFLQTFLDKFASILGIDKDKVIEAAKEAGKQTVDEALQQGKITQEQADAMKARIEEGRFLPGPFMGPKPHGFGGPRLERVAQALGMTADELKAELDKGKSISDIAKEKGLTEEQLRQKVVEAEIQAIQQAVKEGKIPQDKADQMIQRLQNAPQDKGPMPFGRRSFGPPATGQQAQ